MLALSDEALGALSGGTLDTEAFEEVGEAMPYPSYQEELQPDEHGTSYAVQALFALAGEGSSLSEFEAKYINANVDALCILPSGDMRLFTRLSMKRTANTGTSPADFSGRSYTLSGISWEEGQWVDNLA
jgi:hypothetical protein